MIDHLSPSSLCLFKSAPSLWVLKYLCGARDDAGPAAWRGSAVEAGLDVVLYNEIFNESTRINPLEKALQRYELDAQGVLDEKNDKARSLIPKFLDQAIEATEGLPVPSARQFKIQHWFDGIEWPIDGYVDYLWPDFLIDLKTTEKMPSAPRADHILQVSIYAAATKRPAKLLYVTPKKFQWFDVDDKMQKAGLEEAHRLARNIQAMLKLSDDPRALLRALPVDEDNFRWNDNLKQLHHQELSYDAET